MLTRRESGTLTILFEGRPIKARTDDSIAVALLAAGVLVATGGCYTSVPDP